MCHLDRSPRKKYEGRVEKRYPVVRTKKGNGGMKDRVDRSSKTRGMRQQKKNTYKFIVKVTRDSRNSRNERNRI